ncbi:DUF4982 domain-containing protein, partial [Neobacillus niacini]|uniref:DUF4982 domain-containing protein n=1 Tax=Neobacillus niacini TaxID=86668 RepID=UPI0030037578
NLGLPVVEGEFNREEAARRVWDRSTPGYENYKTAPSSSYNLTSEEFAKNQAKNYAKISATAHSGGANWIFSDSTSHGRVFSEVTRASGEVDAVMLPKEAYYTTKAIYSDDPQVHIIGHWNYPAGTVKDMFVMSNAEKVELFVNGKSLGFGSRSDTYLFTFKNVQWEQGSIKAIAYDKDSKVIAEQEKKTTGEPAAVKLTPITGPTGLKANGADVLLIDAEVVDAEGNRVPTFEGRIDFKMEGPGIWRGGYNSGKEDSTNNTFLDIEAGINRVAIRTTLKSGDIKVSGVIADLESDSITVKSNAVSIKGGLSAELPAVPGFELEQEPSIGDGPVKEPEAPPGEESNPQLITDFSYSGIKESGGVKVNTKNGDKIFSDRDFTFTNLPIYLLGGEYIQAPDDDKTYHALDLMHFTINKDAEVYVAHDDRLPRPAWLTEEYTDTSEKVMLNASPSTLFRKTVKAGTTLTLGGNQDNTSISSSNMYVVFAKETAKKDMLISESFDSEEAGQKPAGWNIVSGPNTDVAVAEKPDAINKSMHLFDTNTNASGDNLAYASKGFSAQTGEVTAEWKVISGGGDWMRMLLLDGAPLPDSVNKSNFVVELYMNGKNLIYKDDKDATKTIQSIELNSWYTMKVVANPSLGTFDLYVNGDKKLSKVLLRNPLKKIDHILFGTGTKYAGELYIDDVKVTPGVN